MTETLSVTLAQTNPKVGDVGANTREIINLIQHYQGDTDVLVFPELAVTGYPPEDLLLRQDFLQRAQTAVQSITQQVKHEWVILGAPLVREGNTYNALLVLHQGKVVCEYFKRELPNFNVFDEKRHFTAGDSAQIVDIKGVKVGLTVCEDIWQPRPVDETVALGAELIISINASPYHQHKTHEREQLVVAGLAKKYGVPFVYVNQVGGQDELVFDGASLVVNHLGEITARLPIFEQASRSVDFEPQLADHNKQTVWVPKQASLSPLGAPLARIYDAMVLGVRDYVTKNGFKGIILGLSGGIDSALVMAIAADALGAANVRAVMMPYTYTSDMSKTDAQKQAEVMGVNYHVISIKPVVDATMAQLASLFEGLGEDTTEENVQARSRSMLLMALSNKFGEMVLTTGNKSEMAVGYATLYGDMAGGFAPIKDAPKTLVYDLAKYRNTVAPVIPERVITRPPSAELRPDQVDQDSLPDYDVLDAILEAFIEQDAAPEAIIAKGFDAALVHRVVKMVVRNEYKRRQAAPGVRISTRAFGRDRRYPITQGFF